MALINGTCVAIEDLAILIRGAPGAGKSDLALRLIDAGAQLISDDYCETTTSDGALVASPPRTISNKLEVRGYGIVKFSTTNSATIALVVDLMPESEIERMPASNTCVIDGIELRHLVVDARTPSAPAKIRLALRAEPEQD
jgi:HPr kinase/phosphorylase